MVKAKFVPLAHRKYPLEETKRRAASFYEEVKRRRSVRDFSNKPVPKEVIEHCLLAAGTAPNGANLQPWHFVAVSNREVKRRIRRGGRGRRERVL